MCICGVLRLDPGVANFMIRGNYVSLIQQQWPSTPQGLGHHTPVRDDYPNVSILCAPLNHSLEGPTTSNGFKAKTYILYPLVLCILGHLVTLQRFVHLLQCDFSP